MKPTGKSIPCAMAAAVLATLAAAGCDQSRNTTTQGNYQSFDDPLAVVNMPQSSSRSGQSTATGPAPAPAPDAPSSNRAGREQASEFQAVFTEPSIEESRPWTVVLTTYTVDGHERLAQQAAARLRSMHSALSEARAVTTERGSMVVAGAYERPDSTRAQGDLQRIKELEIEGRQLFAGAMLSRVSLRSPGSGHPHNLLAARRAHPNVNPLYTLQIAAWSDFDTGEFTPQQIRRAAEQYCAQLRAQGYEAWFHHDATRNISVVTVGLFDRTDIDPQARLSSPRLEQLRRQFPVHYVNGESVEAPLRSGRRITGTVTKQPYLVEVPQR